MKAIKIAVMMFAASLAGCATLFSEDYATINVSTSNGKKVDITVDGQNYTAPTTVKLEKDGSTKVIATQDISCASSTAVRKKLEVVTFINVFSTTGFTTDAATGSMWTYDNAVIDCQ